MEQQINTELTQQDYTNLLSLVNAANIKGAESEHISILKYKLQLKTQPEPEPEKGKKTKE